MRKWILVSLLVLGFVGNSVLAKEAEKASVSKKVPANALSSTQAGQDKQNEILIGDINNLRNLELRVVVLQQLANEEITKLRSVQLTFCDRYKLDIDKFNKGLYIYDEQQKKFIENTPPKDK